MKARRLALISAGVLTTTALLAANGTQQDLVAQQRQLYLQRADRLAQDTLGTLAVSTDPCNSVASLAVNAGVFGLRENFSLAVASCINEESSTPARFLACLRAAFLAYQDGLAEIATQNAARLDLCALTGGGVYDPDLDGDEFEDEVDHPYFPNLPGAIWNYRGVTTEGVEEVTVTVTGETRDIDGVLGTAVRDVVKLNGVVVEDTTDWFGQHEDGTVWYLGESVQNFEDGFLVGVAGSWLAGVDGALPGTAMLSNPTVGTTYRQELQLTEAEDAATVLSINQTVTIGLGTFTHCLVTSDFTPISPGKIENKFYAPGIGLILEVDPSTGERLELISFTPGS